MCVCVSEFCPHHGPLLGALRTLCPDEDHRRGDFWQGPDTVGEALWMTGRSLWPWISTYK